MARLVAAEFGKLVTTRLWVWLLLGSVALTSLYASLAIAFSDDPDNPTPSLATAAGQRTLFSVGTGAATLAAVLAVIGMTGEFRHRTATATFLATPRRRDVVLAKLVTYGLTGAGYGLACVAVTIAIARPWLSGRHIEVEVTGNGIPGTLAGVVVGTALYALIGVGLGALLRDQVATVAGLLVYLFVAEPVLTRVPALHGWTRYLPGAAANALSRVSQSNVQYLEAWQGGLVLAGYAAVLAVAGTLATDRRDVT